MAKNNTHLKLVKSSADYRKFQQSIEKAVLAVYEGDHSMEALPLLIDMVASDHADREQVRAWILEAAFRRTATYSDALLSWMDRQERIEKRRRA